ncbi:Uncharacterised protein [BD1-7 clade bacterium]|uniref:DUF11 domain-containing protein n=1 Tax=BD1-7 clade bacterium TaxID=2029982 RepID=A0A5S9PSI5_9GAMM|nr:Uncharacterised protein [BD1-7 clade bacterium]CAA0094380.1 Uncharacterised protein [BD1-7 clade bacterium]CAA0107711.1 Uncharacterised protein [BD1-7 clade bacterium]
MIKLLKVFSATSLFLFATSVFAADPLSSTLDVFVVDDKGEKGALLEKDSVEPGQVLEYQLTYTNNTEKPLQITAATGLIPENTAYVTGSAEGQVVAEFLVSIDKGTNYESEPVKRTRTVGGKTETYIVPVSEYTNVRWVKPEPIEAGKSQIYQYRVKVN